MEERKANMFQTPISVDIAAPALGAGIARELARESDGQFQSLYLDGLRNLSLARKLLAERKMRDESLGPGLFTDPAWDILLALYVGKLQQVRLKLTAVVEESGVPATTVLRWINTLGERGFIIRSNHPTDARCNLIELTDEAASRVTAYINEFRDFIVKAC